MFGTGCLKIQYFFLKWPLCKFLNIKQKTSIFQAIVLLINIYWVFKLKPFCDPEAQNSVQKVDIKINFKKELASKHMRFQPIVGASKKNNIGPLFLSSEMIIDQG